MNVLEFDSLKDLRLYRENLAVNIYELEGIIRKKKNEVKYNGGISDLSKWENDFRDSIGINSLNRELINVNDCLYDVEVMRNMSNGECLSVLLNVLNRDGKKYGLKFISFESVSIVFIVSNDYDFTKRDFILYDIVPIIHNKGDYLDTDSYLKYSYNGMSDEDMDRVNEDMFNRYKLSKSKVVSSIKERIRK